MDQHQDVRIAELEAKVAQLAEMLRPNLGAGSGDVVDAGEASDVQRSSRRGMLKLAGAVAAGAVASTVAARPAAATTDEAIVTGHINSATQQTMIRYGGAINGGPGVSRGPDLTGSTAMVNIDASLSPSTNTQGLLVAGRGAGISVQSETDSGVIARGEVGVFAIGSGEYGVLSFGGSYAVAASLSNKANLWLQPNNNFIGPSPKTPPLQRADAHLVGEIDNVDGDLWMCVAAGTPGGWRKITGPAAAGSLHLLATPKRVYDSRPPEEPVLIAPKTPLAANTARTVDCTLNGSGIPAAARGVLLNVGVVSASGLGFLAVTPGGAGFTGTSSLNWNGAGIAIANGITVACGAGATVDLYAGAGTTDVFVDAFGYYI